MKNNRPTKSYNISLVLFSVLFLSLLLSAFSPQTASAKSALAGITATRTRTKIRTVTRTPTRTAAKTRTITRTPTRTVTKTRTGTITRTRTSAPTLTRTKTSTLTLTPTITKTVTQTSTSTATFTLTPTLTNTNTQTSTPTETFTLTPTITNTVTETSTSTETDTLTPTVTNTDTQTSTPTETPTLTLTTTQTNTSTSTKTATITLTPTARNTKTPAPLPTLYFQPYWTFPATGGGNSATIGDFNHDGLMDVALTTPTQLLIYLQNSDGSLAASVAYNVGNGYYKSIAVGDLNHDGWADLVVANPSDNTISVLLQQADGTFASQVTYATNSSPDAVAVGDLNGDGLDDIAVAHATAPNIGIFIQNVGGLLNSMVAYASPQAGYDDIAIGDVNGDGRNDVVKSNGQGANPQLSVYLQNGSGTLGTAVPYTITGCSSFCRPLSVSIGDVTGDARADIVMSYGGNRPTSNIAVFAQSTDGSLLPFVSYPAYDIPQSVKVADINRDGRMDVVTAHNGWEAVGIFLQQSNQILKPYSLVSTPYSSYQPEGMAVGDINHDGLPDIVVADNNNGLVVLYQSLTFVPTRTSTITPTRTITPTPTITLTPTITMTRTITPTPTISLTPTITPTPTITLTPTITPLPLALPVFPSYVARPVAGGQGAAVGVGDFNHDGLLDAAITTQNQLLVYMQNANGSLAAPVTYADGMRPLSMSVGDLNHDGWADIVTTNFDANTISVFLQQANGTFANRVTYATSTSPDAVAIGDLNGDGLDDIAVSHWTAPNIGIFIQNAGGSLNNMVTYTSPEAGYDDIAIGDINGDGRNDVVKSNGQGINPQLSVYLQNSSGTLATAVSYTMSCTDCLASGVSIGDVTGDSRADIVISYHIGASGIGVFAQATDGSLLPVVSYPAYSSPGPIKIADVNLDGHPDVVTGHSGSIKLGLFLQQSNQTLTSYALYNIPYSGGGYNPEGMAIADINHDGLPDILIADANNGLLTVYQSLIPTPTPTHTMTPTRTVTLTLTVTSTRTVTSTPTFGLTSTPTLTRTITPTGTITPTPTITYTPTITPTLPPVLFRTPTNFPASNGKAVQVGDFNHDGLQDAAMATTTGSLLVYLQNTNGTLPVTPVTYAIGNNTFFISTGDLNHDGLTDIVVSLHDTAAIGMLLQQPDGTLANMVSYAASGGAVGVAVGDLNGDGLDDVVVANYTTAASSIDVFTQDVNGALNVKISYPAPENGFSIAIADINGDGRNDVIATNISVIFANPSIYLQNNDGTLASPYMLTCSYCTGGFFDSGFGVAVGDVNNDGRQDIVTPYDTVFAVYIQASNGSFQPAVLYPTSQSFIRSVRLSDVNKDGLLDVIALSDNNSASSIAVYLGQGNGTFAAAWTSPLPSNSYFPDALNVGDLNHDTWPDLVVARTGGLLVYYNGLPTP